MMKSPVVKASFVPLRRLAAAALAAAALAGTAAAQTPFVDATKVDPTALPPPEPPTPAAIVKAFVDGCVANEGDPVAATDWALAQGFLPIDPSNDAPLQLLNGQPGTVLTMPGTAGKVLMAVGADRRCTLWTEQALGPGVRNALRQAMSELQAKGAQVQTVVDRAVERAGAWRQHEQMRYRRVGGSQDFAVASVTTLTSRLAVQALNFGPYAATAREPDGLAAR
jgi:hypothetical protein